jgi:c(7)-type cytochrome triheme protein
MRKAFAYFLSLVMFGGTALLSQNKTPPAKVISPAKVGAVTFDHAAHAKREKNDCKTCHTSLFAQDSKTPLGFKPPHKSEEDQKVSCGFCHRAGGTAFETKGDCNNGKCHVRPGSKQG